MSQDTNVNNLIINKLTKAQYEGISNPSDTELYLITDDSGITSNDVTGALGYTPENQANKVTSISSSSTDTQYPSAKLVYDQLQLKQNELVSGTNIKTINNQSILGNGNIEIQAGGTVDQTYDATSVNAQSGTAVAGALSDYVTIGTNQNITGEKTFVGNKRIKLKGTSSSSKLGFTAYDNSNREVGYLEGAGTGNTSHSFRLGIHDETSTNYDNILGFEYYKEKGTDGSLHHYNLLCPPLYPSTTSQDFYIPMSVTNGTLTVNADNKGSVDISSLLPDTSDFVTSSTLSTTLEDYQPLLVSGTSIKTINGISLLGSGNITIEGGGGGTVDQTYDPTSANAQSGVAINGAGFITSSALSGYVTSTEMTNGSISPVFDDTVTIGGRSIYYDSDDNIWYMGVEVNASAFSIADYKAYTETDAETGENSLFISSGITNDYIEFSSNGGVLYNGEEVATQTWVTNQGYTTNVGTVTSVNNTQPDANGNVTLTIPDTATWGNITGTLSDQTDLQTALDAKQNTISDLSTIRSGASLGATALQPNDNITELVNNAGYITGITSSDVTTALGYTPYNSTNPSGYITSSDLPTVDQTFDGTSQNAQSGVAIAGELNNYVPKEYLNTKIDISPSGLTISDTESQTKGSTLIISKAKGVSLGYIDETDMSNIIANTISANANGILLQSMNTNGLSAVTLTSVNNNLAINGTEVQEKLVSGTNIKTINNQSLLGNGNIDIQGGGGGVDVQAYTATEVETLWEST